MIPLHISQNPSKSPLAFHESLGTKLQQHIMPVSTHSLKDGRLLGQLSLATDTVVHVHSHYRHMQSILGFSSHLNGASYSQASAMQRYHPA